MQRSHAREERKESGDTVRGAPALPACKQVNVEERNVAGTAPALSGHPVCAGPGAVGFL